MKEGLTLSLAGIAAGALLAWAASGVLRSLLCSVSATDGACSRQQPSDWRR